jgi:hypothetical protein
MKNGKKPNKKQAIAITTAELDATAWLIVKNLKDELHLVHRETGETQVIAT